MSLEIIRIVGLVLFSSVKFLFAPSTVYISGYTYWETILITIGGGLLGVFVFFYTGKAIFDFWKNRFGKESKKKSFTRRNRLLIKVKTSWGIFGLAFISPCLISIPFGALIAAKYFRYDRRTLPAFVVAVVFWSFTLTTLTSLVGPLFD